jgi:hypothetical protein
MLQVQETVSRPNETLMNELRVLLVAPQVANINAIPEIRTIAGLHRIFPLNGYVSLKDVYDAARADNYDIIHFAIHSNTDALHLNGDTLTPEDVAQIARLAHTKLVVLNSCYSGRHASFAVSHGVDFAIYSNIEVVDATAWKFPIALYEFLYDQISASRQVNYAKAFNDADAGDGNYGITSAYDRTGIMPLQADIGMLKIRVWWLLIAAVLNFLGLITVQLFFR